MSTTTTTTTNTNTLFNKVHLKSNEVVIIVISCFILIAIVFVSLSAAGIFDESDTTDFPSVTPVP